MEALHHAAVSTIAERIRKHVSSGSRAKLRFSHGSTNSTSAIRAMHDDVTIDISRLDKVLEVMSNIARVEPNVSMGVLAKTTLSRGMLPAVVMEFPGITVGGGIQGGALESSSWRYGQFNDAALEYEIVTGSGTVVRASPAQYADLFYGISGSYGSLGLLTEASLRLVPAKPYVHVRYRRTGDAHDALEALNEACSAHKVAFIESIILDRDTSILITGHFAEEAHLPIWTFSYPSDEWFWRHAASIAKRFPAHEEIVPILDYLFRYDRGAFWMGEYAFSKFFIPHNIVTRTLFNPIMNTRKLYEALHASRASQSYFIQDAYIPKDSAADFLAASQKQLDIYPVWLCPVKPTALPQKLSPHYSGADHLIDIGLWGKPRNISSEYLEINRYFEQLVHSLGGRKMLYAETLYTEEEFWNVYDRSWYEALRKKYDAEEAFPDIWQKVCLSKTYPESTSGLFSFIANQLLGKSALSPR